MSFFLKNTKKNRKNPQKTKKNNNNKNRFENPKTRNICINQYFRFSSSTPESREDLRTWHRPPRTHLVSLVLDIPEGPCNKRLTFVLRIPCHGFPSVVLFRTLVCHSLSLPWPIQTFSDISPPETHVTPSVDTAYSLTIVLPLTVIHGIDRFWTLPFCRIVFVFVFGCFCLLRHSSPSSGDFRVIRHC